MDLRLHKVTWDGSYMDYDIAQTGTGYQSQCGSGTDIIIDKTDEATQYQWTQEWKTRNDAIHPGLLDFEQGVSGNKTEFDKNSDGAADLKLHVMSVPKGYAYYVTESITRDDVGTRWQEFTVHLTRSTPFSFTLADENGTLLTKRASFFLADEFSETVELQELTLAGIPAWQTTLAAGCTYHLIQQEVTDANIFELGATWTIKTDAEGNATVTCDTPRAFGAYEDELGGVKVTVLQDRFVNSKEITLDKEWLDDVGNVVDGPYVEGVDGVRVRCAWTSAADPQENDWNEITVDLTSGNEFTNTFTVPSGATWIRLKESAYLNEDGDSLGESFEGYNSTR